MCDPMIAAGAGAVGDAAGAFFAASAQKRAYKTNAIIADLNAKATDETGRQAARRGSFIASETRRRAASVKSGQRVAIAAGGVALDSGSALEAQISTDYLAEVDVMSIDYNTMLEQNQARTASAGYRGEADMNRGAAAGISPGMAAFTSLAASAGKIAAAGYAQGGGKGGGGMGGAAIRLPSGWVYSG